MLADGGAQCSRSFCCTFSARIDGRAVLTGHQAAARMGVCIRYSAAHLLLGRLWLCCVRLRGWLGCQPRRAARNQHHESLRLIETLGLTLCATYLVLSRLQRCLHLGLLQAHSSMCAAHLLLGRLLLGRLLHCISILWLWINSSSRWLLARPGQHHKALISFLGTLRLAMLGVSGQI